MFSDSAADGREDDDCEPGPMPEVPPELLMEQPVSDWDLLVQESLLAELPPAERFLLPDRAQEEPEDDEPPF